VPDAHVQVKHPIEFMEMQETEQFISRGAQIVPPDELPLPGVTPLPGTRGATVLTSEPDELFVEPVS